MKIPAWLSLIFAVALSGCTSNTKSVPTHTETATPASTNVFDDFMYADTTPADGFDFACGNPDGKGEYLDKVTGRRFDGWHIATKFTEKYRFGIHTGEDWNGNGGGNTDLGQPVYSVAHGRVVFAGNCGTSWGNVVVIHHTFYENNERKQLRSVYAHLLDHNVRAGEEVKRRQRIGSIGQDPDKTLYAHLHLELRWDESLGPDFWPSANGRDQEWVRSHYAEPSDFISTHRRLFVPQNEATLLLADQESYKMRFYRLGKEQGEYDVSFGQAKGQNGYREIIKRRRACIS